MGKLIVSVQTTLDGVLDQQEDWFDEQGDVKDHGVEELEAADAVLLGRETYQALSGFWPSAEGRYADLVNPMPKYVASRTLSGSLEWNAKLLDPDTAAAVTAAKEAHAGPLISYGCGELATFLAHQGLVDEVRIWVHPVVWGNGVRAFHAGDLPVRLRLITAAPYSSGVVRLSYEPAAD
jgi:dihydrofolate reductase